MRRGIVGPWPKTMKDHREAQSHMSSMAEAPGTKPPQDKLIANGSGWHISIHQQMCICFYIHAYCTYILTSYGHMDATLLVLRLVYIYMLILYICMFLAHTCADQYPFGASKPERLLWLDAGHGQ